MAATGQAWPRMAPAWLKHGFGIAVAWLWQRSRAAAVCLWPFLVLATMALCHCSAWPGMALAVPWQGSAVAPPWLATAWHGSSMAGHSLALAGNGPPPPCMAPAGPAMEGHACAWLGPRPPYNSRAAKGLPGLNVLYHCRPSLQHGPPPLPLATMALPSFGMAAAVGRLCPLPNRGKGWKGVDPPTPHNHISQRMSKMVFHTIQNLLGAPPSSSPPPHGGIPNRTAALAWLQHGLA